LLVLDFLNEISLPLENGPLGIDTHLRPFAQSCSEKLLWQLFFLGCPFCAEIAFFGHITRHRSGGDAG
jgi:hypothetical protein